MSLLLQLLLLSPPILPESIVCMELLPTSPIFMCRSLPMNKSPLMLQFGIATFGVITKLGEDGIEIVLKLELNHGKVLSGVRRAVFVTDEKMVGTHVMRTLNDKIDIAVPIMRTQDLDHIIHLTLATSKSMLSDDTHLLQRDPSDLEYSLLSASLLSRRLEELTLNIDAIDSYSPQNVKLELPSPHLCQRSEESPIYRRSPEATLSTPQ